MQEPILNLSPNLNHHSNCLSAPYFQCSCYWLVINCAEELEITPTVSLSVTLSAELLRFLQPLTPCCASLCHDRCDDDRQGQNGALGAHRGYKQRVLLTVRGGPLPTSDCLARGARIRGHGPVLVQVYFFVGQVRADTDVDTELSFPSPTRRHGLRCSSVPEGTA